MPSLLNPSGLRSLFSCCFHREAMMIFRPLSPPASSRTSPLALRSSAKPSFYRRVWTGRELRGGTNRGCEEASTTYPFLAWPWCGGCNGIVGYGGRGNKFSFVLLVEISSAPTQPLTTSSFCTRRRKSRKRRSPHYARMSQP